MEELLQQIANEIHNLAQPRCFDYVMLVLTLLSICVSVYALIYAIRVPIKIADRQDKIALYEKKITAFMELQDYFDSPERWRISILKFIDSTVKFPREKIFDLTNERLFQKASMLYSESVSQLLLDIHANYKRINYLEQCIDSYLDMLKPDKLKDAFKEYLRKKIHSEKEDAEFKEICGKFAIEYEEGVDECTSKKVIYNFYDLNTTSNDLYMENIKLQKKVIALMEKEIKL